MLARRVERNAVLGSTVQRWIFEAHIGDPTADATLRVLLTIVTWVTRVIVQSQPMHVRVEGLRLGLEENQRLVIVIVVLFKRVRGLVISGLVT